MSLSSVSIRRPVLATVLSILIMVFGLIGYSYLGVREFPAVDPPTITVTTSYRGASADIIESQITEIIEESVNGIAGIRSITSVSREQQSSITVEFDLGVDLDVAANDVRDRVSRVIRSLPVDADPPTVAKADANAFPIIMATLQSDTRSILEVTAIGTRLKERFQTIPGVAEVRIWGEKKYAMRLWIDPKKLAAYDLTVVDVRNALNAENVELPSGRIEGRESELSVRTMGRLNTPEDFNRLILRAEGSTVVRFQDVGRAVLAPENERTILKKGGVPMIGLALSAQPGANNLAIAEEFHKRFARVQKDVPKDVILKLGFDSTRFIKKSILEVQETVFIAFLLVLLIIFLFLRDWRTTIIPVLAIPVSLIGTFFIMYVSGFTLNVLTLLGIVLAIGLVVDDAIVVLENIYAKIEQGMDPVEAGHKGSAEIFFAVVSTTLVLGVVFLPIIFLQGFTGRLFREFGVVVAGSVFISAFVSLSLTPMMTTRIVKKRARHSRFYERTEPFFRWMQDAYRSSLDAFIAKRWLAWVIVAATLGAAAFFFLNLKEELAPMEDRSMFMVNATAQEGATFEYMDAYMDKMIKMVGDATPESDVLLSVTAPGFSASAGVNSGFIRMYLVDPDKRTRSQMEIANAAFAKAKGLSGARVNVVQDQTIQVGGRAGLPMQMIIQAPSFEKLKEILPKFVEEARANPVFTVVEENLKLNKPELRVDIDRERMRSLGVSVRDVATAMQLAFSDLRFDYFIKDGRQYQVIGRVDKEFRNDPGDLKNINVKNAKGELVSLDNLITYKEQINPPQLYRYNRYVSATISAGLAPGMTLGDGIKAMQGVADKVLDPSFVTALAGPARDQAEASSGLWFALALAVVLVYLVLAAQFESYRDPLIVMFTVPLALCGALLALWYFNQTLNIFSKIGIIMLIGLVTKNGILIVEFANQRRHQGLDLVAAVKDAAVSRFRPILMTSLATVLGTLPIALALGAGAKSRMPMGIAVVGGLLFSLVLTLYVVPAMYSYLAKRELAAGLRFPSRVSLFSLFLLPSLLIAAEPLSLSDALRISLDSNRTYRASVLDARSAAESVSWGEAGILPKVDATASYTRSINDTRQERIGSAPEVKSGAASSSKQAGVMGTWTVFDGFASLAAYQRLSSTAALADERREEARQNLAAGVTLFYVDVVRQRTVLAALDSAVALSRERVKITQGKYGFGSVSKLELLQAQLDLNEDLSARLKQALALDNAKRDLNRLLARDDSAAFDVEDSIVLGAPPPFAGLRAAALDGSPGVKQAALSRRLASVGYRESVGRLFPQVGLSLGYNYGLTESEAGFIKSNEAFGPTYGVNLKMNLFDGFTLGDTYRNAKRAMAKAGLQYDEAKAGVDASLAEADAAYRASLEILGLESSNLALARENVGIAMERLRLGTIASLELRAAQEKFVSAETRLVSARFESKRAETELLRLAGRLAMGSP